MKDRLSKISSVVMVGLTLHGAIDTKNPTVDKTEAREREIITVTKYGQFGQYPGVGSLGFLDNGRHVVDSDSFVQNAIARHKRAEEAFGRELDMHIDVPTFYGMKDENGGVYPVFNQNTGDIIEKYFEETEKQGINSTFSICIVPPNGSTKEDIFKAINHIFSGEMAGLPEYILKKHIDKISLTVDFEFMVMGEAYANNGPINHIPLELVQDVNALYIYQHQSIQSSKPLSWDRLYVPQINFYNFGVVGDDDMYKYPKGSKPHFPINSRIISDAIGTADFKALSAKNFTELYNVPVATMFFLPASPALLNDGRQSDTGFGPWDLERIARWADLNSRDNLIMTH